MVPSTKSCGDGGAGGAGPDIVKLEVIWAGASKRYRCFANPSVRRSAPLAPAVAFAPSPLKAPELAPAPSVVAPPASVLPARAPLFAVPVAPVPPTPTAHVVEAAIQFRLPSYPLIDAALHRATETPASPAPESPTLNLLRAGALR